MKKYTVNESIWLAAAVHAWNAYRKNTDDELDFCLKASQLKQIAQEISVGDVNEARIHQHANGDHEKCSKRFLRRVEANKRDPYFRVTATGEFGGDREFPGELNMDDIVEIDGIKYVIGDIKNFIDKQYCALIESFHKKSERKAATNWLISGNPSFFDIMRTSWYGKDI
jgi:hypothetical protein